GAGSHLACSCRRVTMRPGPTLAIETSVSAGDHRTFDSRLLIASDRRSSPDSMRRAAAYMAQVKVPELVVPQLKLFTSRTASTVNEPRPKRALATDTPPFVVLSTLVFSVLSC